MTVPDYSTRSYFGNLMVGRFCWIVEFDVVPWHLEGFMKKGVVTEIFYDSPDHKCSIVAQVIIDEGTKTQSLRNVYRNYEIFPYTDEVQELLGRVKGLAISHQKALDVKDIQISTFQDALAAIGRGIKK